MSEAIALLTAGFLLAGSPGLPGDGISITKIFGTEIPGEYELPASITELDNGDLYLVYYGGSGEYEEDSCLWGSRLKKEGAAWSRPLVVADAPFYSEGNPVVWQAPDGLVWLFYVQRYGATWSDSRIQAKISKNGAQTWSDSFVVAAELGMMVRSHPIVLKDGDYLLPIYHETGHDPEFVAPDTCSLFLRYSPKTHTFTETNRIYSRKGNLQPAAVQLTDEHLVAYCRRGGGYEPIHDGYMVRSESHDGGRTWSSGVETEFPNPNGSLQFIKLRNGHLLLVYNDNMNDERPLTAAISTDGAKTFPYKCNIVDGENIFSYPTAIQTKDGKIHVLYITDERKTMKTSRVAMCVATPDPQLRASIENKRQELIGAEAAIQFDPARTDADFQQLVQLGEPLK
jgi:predicted neuraminidase